MTTLENIKPASFSVEPSKIDDCGDGVAPPNFLVGRKNDLLTSHDVVEKIRVELRYLDEEIRDHLYIKMLKQKKVDLPTLRAFPGHQYHIMQSNLRSMAMMIHRFGLPSEQSFFMQAYHDGSEALTNLLPFAQKFGMSGDELEHYPITHEGFGYATYMGWLSMYGSAAEIVAGFLVNFSAWGFNCGQMSQSLQLHYGFTFEDTRFLDIFATIPSCEPVALEIIQNGLDEGVAPWRIQRAAYLFQGYEKMYWDTMVKLGTV